MKNIVPKVLIGAALLVVVVLLAVFLRPTGQAYTTPPIGPIDLNVTESASISVQFVTSWDISLVPSQGVQREYHIEVFPFEDTDYSMINYSVSLSGTRLFEGLLGNGLRTSGNIYLDFDNVPDIELSYDGSELTVRNIVYDEPSAAIISLLDIDGTPVESELSAVSPDDVIERYVKVESTPLATVTAYKNDGTQLSDSEFYDITEDEPSTAHVLKGLTFTPDDVGVYRITVIADVNGEETERDFLFSVGSIVATLQEDNFPLMTLTKVEQATYDQYEITFNFTGGLRMQAFSPSCDVGRSVIGSTDFEDKVKGIYSWDETEQVLARTIPDLWSGTSEITNLKQDKGYYIRLKDGVDTFSFTEECNDYFTASHNPFNELVSVQEGWNLIGIPGFERMSIEDLNVGEELEITEMYVIKDNDVKESGITMLEPGKAYWVFVE